jgi:hypothetical protein
MQISGCEELRPWRTTTCAVPPSTSIDTPMFWTVQRGSPSGVVSTGIVIAPAADRSIVATRLGLEPEGSERTASTVPATRTAITPAAITQVSCRRVTLGVRVPRLGRFRPPLPFRKRSRLRLRASLPLLRYVAASAMVQERKRGRPPIIRPAERPSRGDVSVCRAAAGSARRCEAGAGDQAADPERAREKGEDDHGSRWESATPGLGAFPGVDGERAGVAVPTGAVGDAPLAHAEEEEYDCRSDECR